jgi:hypothetical protein
MSWINRRFESVTGTRYTADEVFHVIDYKLAGLRNGEVETEPGKVTQRAFNSWHQRVVTLAT